MENIYDFILNNIYLFCILIAIVFAVIVFIIYMMKVSHNKNKKVEEEVIIDSNVKSREELESITDEEIEKRILENYSEDKKEEIKEEKTDIEELITSMKNTERANPSEALKKFEDEQEEQAIISYQQLVDSVKNNKINIVDDEEQYKDTNLNFDNYELEIDNEPIENTSQEIKNLNNLIDSFETRLESKEESTYKPNEFISPVFGRMDNSNIKYREGLEYTDKKEKRSAIELPVLEEKEEKPIIKYPEEIKPTFRASKKMDSEEFLRNLKEFRRNL